MRKERGDKALWMRQKPYRKNYELQLTVAKYIVQNNRDQIMSTHLRMHKGCKKNINKI